MQPVHAAVLTPCQGTVDSCVGWQCASVLELTQCTSMELACTTCKQAARSLCVLIHVQVHFQVCCVTTAWTCATRPSRCRSTMHVRTATTDCTHVFVANTWYRHILTWRHRILRGYTCCTRQAGYTGGWHHHTGPERWRMVTPGMARSPHRSPRNLQIQNWRLSCNTETMKTRCRAPETPNASEC